MTMTFSHAGAWLVPLQKCCHCEPFILWTDCPLYCKLMIPPTWPTHGTCILCSNPPHDPLMEHEHRCMLTLFHWWTLNSSALQLWPLLSLASWHSLPTSSTTAPTLGGTVHRTLVTNEVLDCMYPLSSSAWHTNMNLLGECRTLWGECEQAIHLGQGAT